MAFKNHTAITKMTKRCWCCWVTYFPPAAGGVAGGVAGGAAAAGAAAAGAAAAGAAADALKA